MAVPAFLPWFVVLGSIGIIAGLFFVLRSSLAKAGWPEPERARALGVAAAVLVGWLLLSIVLAATGAYRGSGNRAPTIQFGLLVPVLIGAVLLWRSGGFRSLIDAVPQQWLVGVQIYRALGAVFLILLAMNKLPGLFAWPAGIGDVLVGLFAPLVATAYVQSPREARGTVW